MDELAERIEAMIAIQMAAYPDGWDENEKRECAMHHLGLLEDVA